jgi:actin cytoskeleton-regulatory complex protein SLA1
VVDVGKVTPISSTRTLYDYTAQTEEELSFSADLTVEIYDKDDADWFLVGLKQGDSTEYGFVPSNYLDDGEVESAAKLPSVIPAGRPDSLDERRPITPPPLDEDERDEPISPSNAVLPELPSHYNALTGCTGLIEIKMTAYGRPEQHYTIQDPSIEQKFKTWQVEEIDSRKRRKKGTLGIGNQSIAWSCDADKVNTPSPRAVLFLNCGS